MGNRLLGSHQLEHDVTIYFPRGSAGCHLDMLPPLHRHILHHERDGGRGCIVSRRVIRSIHLFWREDGCCFQRHS